MTSEPQDTTESATSQDHHDEPNEFGFAGGATAPTPEPGAEQSSGEAVAVPAGDITGALMSAIDRAGHHDDENEPPAGHRRD